VGAVDIREARAANNAASRSVDLRERDRSARIPFGERLCNEAVHPIDGVHVGRRPPPDLGIKANLAERGHVIVRERDQVDVGASEGGLCHWSGRGTALKRDGWVIGTYCRPCIANHITGPRVTAICKRSCDLLYSNGTRVEWTLL